MADWGDKFMAAWTTIKKKAGACAANTDLEEIKASVELGQKRIDQALMAGSLLQKGDSKVFERLNKANEGLGKIGEALEKVQDICLDISAVGKIHDAAVALSNDRLIYENPEGAAAAFDSMFQGFGRLCRYLPPPAKSWQQFFESFNLFGAMTPKLVPELRWKDQFSQVEGWR
jgi:hypothetical protein